MKFSHWFFSLLVAFVCLPVFLHSAYAGNEEWRPVTPEELALKAPLVDPDADAEAIFWEVRIDDSSSEDLSMRWLSFATRRIKAMS